MCVCVYIFTWASQVVLVIKNLAANAGDIRDVGLIPGSKDSLEEGMATSPVFLPGESLWTEEPSRLPSVGLQRVGHD